MLENKPMKPKLLLLIFCLMFLNSCTYLIVQEVKKMQEVENNPMYEIPDFMNSFDENFVSIETILSKVNEANQTVKFDTVTFLEPDAEIAGTIVKENIRIDNCGISRAITKRPPDTISHTVDTSFIISKEYKITKNITSVNANYYPDSIIIHATVNDNSGGFIAGLAPPYLAENKNVHDYWKFILDSCKGKTHKITNFTVEEIRETTSPKYSICYVLDHSGSMGHERCLALQQSVRYSMSKVKDDDFLSAITFTGVPTVKVRPTDDKNIFIEQFKLVGCRRGGSNDIVLALDSAAELLKTIPDEYQRIIILFTDGEDAMRGYNNVAKKLRQNNIKVFPIGYGRIDFRVMERIAKDTDGKMFYLRRITDFAKAFQYIYHTLTNYYKITYKPPVCEDLHYVTVNLSLSEIGFDSIESFGEYDKSVFTDFVEVGTVALMDIEFEFGSSTVSKESLKLLEDIAQQLKRHPDIKLEISGHTDDIGGDDFNMRLSLERAKSVKNELVKMGINSRRLTVKGYGKTKPIMPNDSDENRKRNRRTEFTVVG